MDGLPHLPLSEWPRIGLDAAKEIAAANINTLTYMLSPADSLLFFAWLDTLSGEQEQYMEAVDKAITVIHPDPTNNQNGGTEDE